MSKHRTHKASSAESILKHALRQRGWSKQWRRGELTGKQHLSLLEDIRQYGRAWLRHEAEAFFDTYGVEDELWNIDATAADTGRSVEIQRGDGEGMGSESVTPSGDGSIRVVHRGLASRAVGAIGRFFDRARQFVRELVVSGAMALKGNEPLSNDELAMLDRQARIQAEYLERFQKEVTHNPPIEIADLQPVTVLVEPAPMTSGQFIARAESYGNVPWGTAQNVGRQVVAAQGVFAVERRVHYLSESEHRYCRTCIEQSRLGWQTMGTLLEIGDSECMGNCDCYFEWKTSKGAIHTSPWGRHNPKAFVGIPGIAYGDEEGIPPGPAIPTLPGTGGPPEKKKPGAPPKGRVPTPKPLPETFEQLKKQAEEAGSTFPPGVDYHYEEAP